jgi:hypothetical protein
MKRDTRHREAPLSFVSSCRLWNLFSFNDGLFSKRVITFLNVSFDTKRTSEKGFSLGLSIGGTTILFLRNRTSINLLKLMNLKCLIVPRYHDIELFSTDQNFTVNFGTADIPIDPPKINTQYDYEFNYISEYSFIIYDSTEQDYINGKIVNLVGSCITGFYLRSLCFDIKHLPPFKVFINDKLILDVPYPEIFIDSEKRVFIEFPGIIYDFQYYKHFAKIMFYGNMPCKNPCEVIISTVSKKLLCFGSGMCSTRSISTVYLPLR